ncbi:Group 1 family glycosyl transferase [uncultured Paludibacter sp.]|uniref:Group 1 family glycosyl transferase n=1 Tax=uncultured Paludibacter sp. TaxID=497635 RepID=A0A653AAB9_9BACT|nr:Group 1 family glycosyl transferase [uncultured Paludibacter sp.]
MKIAFLFGSLNRGGTETLMLDVCKNLKKEDFKAIGVYRKGGALENDFVRSGVPFYKLRTRKNIISYLWKLRKLILTHHIDILHAQQPIDALYARLACIFTRKKIILTFHSFDFNSNKCLLNYIIKKTDLNIFVSEYQKKYYENKYKLISSKQSVIYNGIDFKKLESAINSNQDSVLRNELRLNEKTLLLGMVGNFNEGRDHFTICQFLNVLNKTGIDFHFLFVGKRIENFATKYDDCVKFCDENKLQKKVSFLGVRNNVPDILVQLDAFIYATEHDTFGIAVVEAMASGMPVFVNDWEVMNEITEQGELATLYGTKDEKDLLEKFMVYLQNKETYKQNAVDIAKIVKEKYSIELHIENLTEVYSQLNQLTTQPTC